MQLGPGLSAGRGPGEADADRCEGNDGDRPPMVLAPAPPFSAAAALSSSSSSLWLPMRGTRSAGSLPRCRGYASQPCSSGWH